MPVAFVITDNSTDINEVVGVAFNGILLRSTAENNYDPFNPQSYGSVLSPTAIDPDLCLGSSGGSSSYYHYYMFSPCILE